MMWGGNPHSLKVMGTYHDVRVLVNGRLLTLEAVDPQGTVVDAFSMEKGPAPPPIPGPPETDDTEGGCGCSVVARPGLLEFPVGLALILVVACILRLRRKHRAGQQFP